MVADFSATPGPVPDKGKEQMHATFRMGEVEMAVIGPPSRDMTTGKKMNRMLITNMKPEPQELIPMPCDPGPRGPFRKVFLRGMAGNR